MLKKTQKIDIDGPVGRLETLMIVPEYPQGVAVLNHPNPLHGGTHDNKVIRTAANTLQKMGYLCYLPNSRGTGNSEGAHDYGRGEVEDVLVVWDYVRRKHADLAHQTVLGGFSFGAYVSIFVAQHIRADKLLLIGAAVNKYPIIAPSVPDIEHTLMIHGQHDEVIKLDDVLAWCAPQKLPAVVVPNAGHFFHGQLPQLAGVIQRFF